MPNHVQSIQDQGFAIVPECLADETVEHLRSCLGNAAHSQRNLLEISAVRDLAVSKPVRQLVADVLGSNCFTVRGLFLNKTPDSNWKVAWHQDRTIAVRERKDAPHFGPWSIKAGAPHVQSPASVMNNMLSIRLHLDKSHTGNGTAPRDPTLSHCRMPHCRRNRSLERGAKRYLYRSPRRRNPDAPSHRSRVVQLHPARAAPRCPSGVCRR